MVKAKTAEQPQAPPVEPAAAPLWKTPELHIPSIRLVRPDFGPEWITAVAVLIVVLFSQSGLFNVPLRHHGPIDVNIVGGAPAPYVPPQPGPGPAPGPVGPFDQLAADAARWAAGVDSRDRAAEARQIADVFETVASKAAAGGYRDLVEIFGSKGRPGDLAQQVGRALGSAANNWKGWGEQLTHGFGHLYETKTLRTTADAAAALRAIAGQIKGVR